MNKFTPTPSSKGEKKMYCVYLQYEKEKPYFFEFSDKRKDVVEYYKQHHLYKPEYTIIKVQVKII